MNRKYSTSSSPSGILTVVSVIKWDPYLTQNTCHPWVVYKLIKDETHLSVQSEREDRTSVRKDHPFRGGKGSDPTFKKQKQMEDLTSHQPYCMTFLLGRENHLFVPFPSDVFVGLHNLMSTNKYCLKVGHVMFWMSSYRGNVFINECYIMYMFYETLFRVFDQIEGNSFLFLRNFFPPSP